MKTRIKIVLAPMWVKPGQMFVLDAREARVGFDPAPHLEFLRDLLQPEKWIVVGNEENRDRLVEAIVASDDLELVE